MPLTIADLTSNVSTDASNIVTGNGVFDDLMGTVTTHLEAQYNLGRITGNDYATVYLGAMQSTLGQGVAYVLGQTKTNAETTLAFQKEVTEFAQTNQITKTAPSATSILGAQVALAQGQVALTKKQTDLSLQKEISEFAQTNQITKLPPSATSILGAQVALAIKQAALVTKQTALATKQTDLSLQKEITEFAQTDQITKLPPSATSIIGTQVALVKKQASLSFQKEVTEFAQTDRSTKTPPSATSIMGAQANVSIKQGNLLFQKEVTEFAQTDKGTKLPPSATSIMGAQAKISIEQAKGFKWNADQKYLKTLMDAWSINISTAGVASTGITAIQDAGMNTQITNAKPTG